MRIALDIDDVLAEFLEAYKVRFNTDKFPKRLQSANITKNVQKLRRDRAFWTGLKVKNRLNFIPELYCTKRVNLKSYTKEWLALNDFPNRPVYQMFYQSGNKATMIKGRCDVLIDDSVYNVTQAIEYGLPALLYTTSENEHVDFPYRIYSLELDEIERMYNLQVNV